MKKLGKNINPIRHLQPMEVQIEKPCDVGTHGITNATEIQS